MAAEPDSTKDVPSHEDVSMEMVLEEYFDDYDRVRRYGSVDMLNISQVEQHAGMPKHIVEHIRRHYSTYLEMNRDNSLSPHAMIVNQQFGHVSATYEDLRTLYGLPSTLRTLEDISLCSNIHWNLMTRYGHVMISYFAKANDNTLTDRELKDVTRWRIAADTDRAYDIISQEVHMHVMKRMYGV